MKMRTPCGRRHPVQQADQLFLLLQIVEQDADPAPDPRRARRPAADWPGRARSGPRSRSPPPRPGGQAVLDQTRAAVSSSRRAASSSAPISACAPRPACRPCSRALRKLDASCRVEGVTPAASGISRFSTVPSSTTMHRQRLIGAQGHELHVLDPAVAHRRGDDRRPRPPGPTAGAWPRPAPPRTAAAPGQPARRSRAAPPRRCRRPPAGRRRTGAGPHGSGSARRWCGARPAAPPASGPAWCCGSRPATAAPRPRQRARPDRLAGLQIGLDHAAEDVARALVQRGQAGRGWSPNGGQGIGGR